MREYFEKLVEILKVILNGLAIFILLWVGFLLFGYFLSFGYAFIFSGIGRVLYFFNQLNSRSAYIAAGKIVEEPMDGFVRGWLIITGSAFLTIGLAMVF